MESYSAAVTTSLHDSKGSYQLSLLHEAKPGKDTAIAASVAVFVHSQVFPMRAPERAQWKLSRLSLLVEAHQAVESTLATAAAA